MPKMSLFAPSLSSLWRQIEDTGLDPESLFLRHGIEKAAIFDNNARVSGIVVDRIMADAGCQCVYVVDSAGAMILDDASDRVAAVVAELGDDAQVGFHGHENLSLSLANTIAAIRAGAVQVDGSTRRFGAGSGNTSCEAIAAVTERIGVNTGLDVLKMIDAAEDVVRPVMDDECVLDRMSMIMGYAGVYSSFLKHAFRASERYGVSGADILMECGNRKLVGGQEDQIIQTAAELAAQQQGSVA